MIALGAASLSFAQETTPIIVTPERSSSIEPVMLVQSKTAGQGVLHGLPLAPGAATVSVPPLGTLFLPIGSGGGGGQAVGVISAAEGFVKGASGGAAPLKFASALPIELAAFDDNKADANAAKGSKNDVVVSFVCIQWKKPDPKEGAKWRMATEQDIERLGLEPLRAQIRRLADGVARVDQKISALAQHVTARRDPANKDKWRLDYNGDSLTEESANLYLSADWTVSDDGKTVTGRLNRSVVVQAAAWALSDGMSRSQFAAWLTDPRFASLQSRERPLRWAIENLLAESGLGAERFIHEGASATVPEEKNAK
jgi:hypothetical protein